MYRGKQWVCGLTIFASSFLLFLIQPLIGKYVLPWFGGGAAVWTTSMLFFQALLLLGYAYAALIARAPLRTQVKVHLVLLGGTLAVMAAAARAWGTSITPGPEWQPPGSALPAWHLLRLLVVAVGLPTLVISTTSPLVQAWFSRACPGRPPYSLYAVSNAASLLALVSYPTLVEPLLSLEMQARAWSLAYTGFALILVACAVVAARAARANPAPAAEPGKKTGAPGWRTLLLWMSLAACGSVLLLATTNRLSQDVAPIPFLWVLPLGLYLLSFIIGFIKRQRGLRRWYGAAALAALLLAVWCLNGPAGPNLGAMIAAHSAVLLLCCTLCHGELYLRRPAPRYLSRFYLAVSVGGALGGGLVSLVAPVIFKGFWEYHLGLVACAAVGIVALFQEKNAWLYDVRGGVGALVAVVVAVICYNPIAALSGALETSRNFYGVLYVQHNSVEGVLMNQLVHGTTIHGMQPASGPDRQRPTAYFSRNSGVGLALTYHPLRLAGQPFRVGVLGLGAGTLAAYGRPGDQMTFYEIDPAIARVAGDDTYFTYLSESQAQVDVVLGDARLSLERDLEKRGSRQFDLLVMDAFTGDAVPTHLLTREAFQVYLAHLADGGILAINVANWYVDLVPVAANQAAHFGLEGVVVDSRSDGQAARWVLLASDAGFLEQPAIAAAGRPLDDDPDLRPWTDDYSNLFQVLR